MANNSRRDDETDMRKLIPYILLLLYIPFITMAATDPDDESTIFSDDTIVSFQMNEVGGPDNQAAFGDISVTLGEGFDLSDAYDSSGAVYVIDPDLDWFNDNITVSTGPLDAIYLRLDTANDPLTGTLDMGDNPLDNLSYIDFDLTDAAANAEGRLKWNSVDGTLEVGMPGGVVTLQIGQEMHIRVTNKSGGDFTNGQVVYVSGAQGSRPTILLADADSEATSSKTIAILTEDIANNGTGYATISGLVRDVDTSGFVAGDVLWLSSTAGDIDNTMPVSPAHAVFVGYCLFSNATTGIIYARIQNGFELYELHDVLITSVADNEMIAWDSGSSLWVNQFVEDNNIDFGIGANQVESSDVPNDTTNFDGNLTGADSDVLAAFETLDDLPIGGGQLAFYLETTASDIGGYKEMNSVYAADAARNSSETIVADDTLIEEWATPTGEPGTSLLQAGLYHFHFFALQTGGTKTSTMYFELYKRTIAPAEVLLGTSGETDNLTGVSVFYDIHFFLADTNILTTDRLVIKVYGNEGGAGTDPVAQINYQDTTFTRFEYPTSIFGNHNSLPGLQGGTTDEYFHLTSAEYADLAVEIDQGGGTGGTYGVLVGLINGANQRYDTTSTFIAAKLQVYLNGQLLIPDGDGYTVFDTDSFDMVVAPPTGSVILTIY